MKKIVWSTVMMFLLSNMVFCSEDNTVTTFLEFIFNSRDFYCENYHIGGKEMLFAYKRKNQSKIFDKAVIMYKNNINFQPILYISQNMIITSSGKIIFEGRSLTQVFYGWTINVVEKSNAFSLEFYTNNGNNVTEGPTIIWDSVNNGFTLYTVDKSQW
jgi:hypothetical protein